MARDLAAARQHLADPATLVVFSGNDTTALCPELADAVVSVDARLQVALSKTDRLHGSKQALAAHAARELLPTTHPWPPRAASCARPTRTS
ncbi:MAG: hypothetical protein HC927_00135 [Deltaproteobacteria bacterium]|nr:hypothetical protein [Deltaproteobacteria bacterium]